MIQQETYLKVADNTARVKTVKKDIARVLTEQRARQIAAEKTAAAE